MTMFTIEENDQVIASPRHLVVELHTDKLVSDTDIWEPDKMLEYIDKVGSVVMYTGVVSSAGKEATAVGISEGDYVIFSSFSGIHLTTTGKLVKVIPITDAMVKINQFIDASSIKPEQLEPLGDRVLMEVIENDDVYEVGELNDNVDVFTEVDLSAQDPRIASITYGKVIALGKQHHDIVKVGDVVVIEHFVGEVISEAGPGNPEIRAMSDLYITAIVRKAGK
jgi:co-chaperonin GroES (HSP10)